MALTRIGSQNVVKQANGASSNGIITSGSLSITIGQIVIVRYIHADNGGAGALVITNSGTAQTWNTVFVTNTGNNCKIAAYYAIMSATQSMTVTVDCVDNGPKVLLVDVYSGQHATTPVPAGNIFNGAGATDVSQSITPTSAGSLLLGAYGDWNQTNSFTGRTDCTIEDTHDDAGQYTGCFIRPTTQPRTDTTAFALGELDTSGKVAWVAFEVQAAASGGPYTLTAAQGTHSSTGQAATLKVGRKVTAAQGTIAITGQAATLTADTADPILTAAQGTYAVTGQAATLKRGLRLTAATGTYLVVGSDAKVDVVVTASQGTYAVSGQAAALVVARKLVAASGTRTLTGQAAGLIATRKLTAAAGAIAITGQAAALSTSDTGSTTLTAEQGSLSVTGQAAALKAGRRLVAAHGTIALTGQAATLSRPARSLMCGYGTYRLSFQTSGAGGVSQRIRMVISIGIGS